MSLRTATLVAAICLIIQTLLTYLSRQIFWTETFYYFINANVVGNLGLIVFFFILYSKQKST